MPRQTDPYVCVPRDAWHVFAEVSAYETLRPLDPEPLSILDIGAHVGAFSLACARKWPKAQIRAYEPDPANAALLRHNTRGLHVEVWECAVTDGASMTRLPFYPGLSSLGGSLHQLGWQQDESDLDVEAIGAGILPPADVVKIDTEGSELAIVKAYPHWQHVRAVFLEWHTEEACARLPLFFRQRGLRLTRRPGPEGPRTGFMVFER